MCIVYCLSIHTLTRRQEVSSQIHIYGLFVCGALRYPCAHMRYLLLHQTRTTPYLHHQSPSSSHSQHITHIPGVRAAIIILFLTTTHHKTFGVVNNNNNAQLLYNICMHITIIYNTIIDPSHITYHHHHHNKTTPSLTTLTTHHTSSLDTTHFFLTVL